MEPGRTPGARRAFSLIELLVVIAIIAILAAILFPVFGRVQENRRQTQCMQQMHDVWTGVRQYREDWGKYPPVLLGFAQDAGGRFTNTNAVPIDRLRFKPLFQGQRYLNDKTLYICPNSPNKDANAVNVVNPLYPAGTPIINALGPNAVFSPVYFANMRPRLPRSLAAPPQPMYFYRYDSYDMGPQIDAQGRATGQFELRYSLDWTGANPGPDDAPNQLKYPNAPPDRTVLTWCSYHAAVGGSDKVLVTLLNGTTKPVPLSRWASSGPLNFNF